PAAGHWAGQIPTRRRAAEPPAVAFAHEQAVQHFQQALDLGERHPERTGPAIDAIAIREQLGDELLMVHDWSRSAASFHASLALISPADRVARARMLRKLARVDERKSSYAEAAGYLEL